MITVLLCDGIGYLMAVGSLSTDTNPQIIAALSDIFVFVAMLSISVGLILPGILAQSVTEVSEAAERLSTGIVKEFADAMQALGRGELEGEPLKIEIVPVRITSRDEIGRMAASFNQLQQQIGSAAQGLIEARIGLQRAQAKLIETNENLSITLRCIFDAVVTTDNRGRVVLINAACEEMTGWTQAKAAGRTIDEVIRLVDPNYREKIVSPVWRVLKGSAPVITRETCMLISGKKEYLVTYSASPVNSSSGELLGTVVVIHDRTEKPTAQKRLS